MSSPPQVQHIFSSTKTHSTLARLKMHPDYECTYLASGKVIHITHPIPRSFLHDVLTFDELLDYEKITSKYYETILRGAPDFPGRVDKKKKYEITLKRIIREVHETVERLEKDPKVRILTTPNTPSLGHMRIHPNFYHHILPSGQEVFAVHPVETKSLVNWLYEELEEFLGDVGKLRDKADFALVANGEDANRGPSYEALNGTLDNLLHFLGPDVMLARLEEQRLEWEVEKMKEAEQRSANVRADARQVDTSKPHQQLFTISPSGEPRLIPGAVYPDGFFPPGQRFPSRPGGDVTIGVARHNPRAKKIERAETGDTSGSSSGKGKKTKQSNSKSEPITSVETLSMKTAVAWKVNRFSRWGAKGIPTENCIVTFLVHILDSSYSKYNLLNLTESGEGIYTKIMAHRNTHPEVLLCTTTEHLTLTSMQSSPNYQHFSFAHGRPLGVTSNLKMHMVHPVPIEYLHALTDAEIELFIMVVANLRDTARKDRQAYDETYDTRPSYGALEVTLDRLHQIKRERAEGLRRQEVGNRRQSRAPGQQEQREGTPREEAGWRASSNSGADSGSHPRRYPPRARQYPPQQAWVPQIPASSAKAYSVPYGPSAYYVPGSPYLFTTASSGTANNQGVPKASPQPQVRDSRVIESSSSSDDCQEAEKKKKKRPQQNKKRHHRKKRCHPPETNFQPQPKIWDPYVRLGVLCTATLEEIVAARRSLTVKYHPDQLMLASTQERERGQIRF
ncbi:hypothetical protein BDV96DRAFT_601311 [Lophiotrema nucula]|uniref:J domain-containing protein n=1 Tax=Lophiotrema nucula TaxID=690887 RepID=A0A6A5Z438_9PLEO|nr:hypothetical protein BDV96DRAFT_601311 [Lophiotrema nucula]